MPYHDPIIKSFGSLANTTSSRNVVISGHVAVAPSETFAESSTSKAAHTSSDLILVPWSETGTLSELPCYIVDSTQRDAVANKEFARLTDDLFHADKRTAGVAAYIDQTVIKTNTSSGSSPNSSPAVSTYDDNIVTYSSDGGKTHLYVLYASAMDDLYTLKFALQLAQDPSVILSITKLTATERLTSDLVHQDDIAFGDLRIHGASLVANKVNYNSPDAATLSDNTFNESGYSLLFVIGRSVVDECELVRVSTGSTVRALGTRDSEVIGRIKSGSVSAGILVVQARDEGSGLTGAVKSSWTWTFQ